MKQLQFRHNCQNLGCADLRCSQCKLSQKRRCDGNFASKYLAPCDVIEAKCAAQIYLVVVDAFTGGLMMHGLEDAFLELSIVDGRRLEQEGSREDILDSCKLLLNKQGQPLLAHGRSGSYSDDKHIVVPMIHGQAMLPDLKVTESSEALLTGRAPPFRLMARAVWRTGERIESIAPVLSEPFVVATARVKGAAKVEIPHMEDHISKLEGLGLQTQKKLEDISSAALAAGVHGLEVPVNSVTKVGQFKELVDLAERNKPLRETLKQVLRLTKGWDLARDHVMKAVHSDVQLRVYHPDGRTDVGLVFKCGAYNIVDVQHPIGLLRRRSNPQIANQDLVDVIWLPQEASCWPDAVRRLVPRAAAAWWNDGHPGWAFLPLNLSHVPVYMEDGNPANSMSSFTFTRPASQPGAPPSPSPQQPLQQPQQEQHAMPQQQFSVQNPGSRIVAPPTQPNLIPAMAFNPMGALPGAALGGVPGGESGLGVSPAAGTLVNTSMFGNLVGVPLGMLPQQHSQQQQQPGGATGGAAMPGVDATRQGSSEDAAFQRMMLMVAGNNNNESEEKLINGLVSQQRGDSETSTGKAKRKADEQLDNWMAQQQLQQRAAAAPIQEHQAQFQMQQGQAGGELPATKITGVSAREMRRMFARAARQEISYQELESFLKAHDLMPEDDGDDNDQENKDVAMGENAGDPAVPAVPSGDDVAMGDEDDKSRGAAANGTTMQNKDEEEDGMGQE